MFYSYLSCIRALESVWCFFFLQLPLDSLELSQFTSLYILDLYAALVNLC